MAILKRSDGNICTLFSIIGNTNIVMTMCAMSNGEEMAGNEANENILND